MKFGVQQNRSPLRRLTSNVFECHSSPWSVWTYSRCQRGLCAVPDRRYSPSPREAETSMRYGPRLCIVQPIEDSSEVPFAWPTQLQRTLPASAGRMLGEYDLYEGSGQKPSCRTIHYSLSHRNIRPHQASSGKQRHRGRIHPAHQYDADRTRQARGFQGEREELARVRASEGAPALGGGLRR